MWGWKAWEVLGRGSLELKIYVPRWLEGLSGIEGGKKVRKNSTAEYAALLQRVSG